MSCATLSPRKERDDSDGVFVKTLTADVVIALRHHCDAWLANQKAREAGGDVE